jgi:hypothetical protein
VRWEGFWGLFKGGVFGDSIERIIIIVGGYMCVGYHLVDEPDVE